MIRGTAGKLALESVLPKPIRDPNATWDSKYVKSLAERLAQEYPHDYRAIMDDIQRLAVMFASRGSMSVDMNDMTPDPSIMSKRDQIRKEIQKRMIALGNAVLRNPDLTHKETTFQPILNLGKKVAELQHPQGVRSTTMVTVGVRGKPANLRAILYGTGLFNYPDGSPVEFPATHGYVEGLTPAEYWANAYGGRASVIAGKLAIRDAGYLSKRMLRLAHRWAVTNRDYPPELERLATSFAIGLPVDTDDDDVEGYLLAAPAGGYSRNTVISHAVLSNLRKKGIKKILVRNPIASFSGAINGVYAADVGIREKGKLPDKGDFVGIIAAHALGEPISQGMLSSKHGVAGGAGVGGYEYLNALFEQPSTLVGRAKYAPVDGVVKEIKKDNLGRYVVRIGNREITLGYGQQPIVKKGQTVYAGDLITRGVPDPVAIARVLGIGEARRVFSESLREAMRESGLPVTRRNTDLIAAAAVNHVRMRDSYGPWEAGDIVLYDAIMNFWEPREDARWAKVDKKLLGKYLELPVLHYSIGTPVNRRVLENLQQFGVKKVMVHDEPPPFEPVFVAASDQLAHDPDWMVRLYGENVMRSVMQQVREGGQGSPRRTTSFVPPVMRGEKFQPQSELPLVPRFKKSL